MFTLRFYRGEYSWVVATKEYAKDPRDGFAFVITGGIEYRIGGDFQEESPVPYDVCYIENDAGKTIDRIGPFVMKDREAA